MSGSNDHIFMSGDLHDCMARGEDVAALSMLADGFFGGAWTPASREGFEADVALVASFGSSLGLSKESQEALKGMDAEAYALFAREAFTAGLPNAAMPVESLYCLRDARGGSSRKNLHAYLNESASHVSALYEELAIELPESFKAMPDHLTLLLELLCIYRENGNLPAARSFAAEHLSWLSDYRVQAAERRVQASSDGRLGAEARAKLDRGFAYLDAALELIESYVRALQAAARRSA